MKTTNLFISIALITALSCLPLSIQACKLKKESHDGESDSDCDGSSDQKQLNVLILTFPAPGHTSVPLALGEELVRRGHNATLAMVGSKTQQAAEKVGIQFKLAGNTSSVDIMQEIRKQSKILHQSSIVERLKTMFTAMPKVYNMFAQQGESIISFAQSEVEAGIKYDMVIATDFLAILLPCVSSYLDAPAMLLGTSLQVYPHTYPPWPWASHLLGIDNENLTFLERLANQVERMLLPYFLNFLLSAPVSTSAIDTVCPNLSADELETSPSIYIPDIIPSVIGFEYSRTMTPLTHYVGPIVSKHHSEISNDLQQWLDAKSDGSVIYISMGSITSVTERMANAFVNGIKNTNYSVVWAMRKERDFELTLDPERFYVSKWLPQVAILQHRAVSFSILHCGANGIHESLYHGVPAICLPGMSEQRSNAARVVNHKLGLKLNTDDVTAEQVYESIKELESGNYKENVLQLGRMFRAAGGAGRAAELVEYYSEVGYSHLVPAYAKYNWSWVQFYNADVYLLLLAILLATGYFWYRLIRCLCVRCCCRQQKVKAD